MLTTFMDDDDPRSALRGGAETASLGGASGGGAYHVKAHALDVVFIPRTTSSAVMMWVPINVRSCNLSSVTCEVASLTSTVR